VAPTNPPKIPTLLTYLPAGSIGLKTTLVGRAAFLLGATVLALWLLRRSPLGYLPHVLDLATYSAAIVGVGGRPVLTSRPVLMVVITCCLLGVVNCLLAPASAARSPVDHMAYGAARASAYASLSFCTLLVASATRPSDLARIAGRFSTNVSILVLLAVPFATFQLLATTYSDILGSCSARSSGVRQPGRAYQQVVDAAGGLFAVALLRALYLSQVSYTFQAAGTPGARKLLPASALVSWVDLLVSILLIPGCTAALIT
jgi:hypothetical protein